MKDPYQNTHYFDAKTSSLATLDRPNLKQKLVMAIDNKEKSKTLKSNPDLQTFGRSPVSTRNKTLNLSKFKSSAATLEIKSGSSKPGQNLKLRQQKNQTILIASSNGLSKHRVGRKMLNNTGNLTQLIDAQDKTPRTQVDAALEMPEIIQKHRGVSAKPASLPHATSLEK